MYRAVRSLVTAILICGLVCLGSGVIAWGQTSNTGSITVTINDQAGASVPGAELQLKDLGTNDIRRAQTQANGTYTFVDLSFGTYRLSVAKTGFDTQVFESVVVQTGRTTSLSTVLKVGGTTQTVTVAETATPLVETDSNVIADTIDTKQVTNLPVIGRNMFNLALLVPGWVSTGANGTTGSFQNLPGAAMGGAEFDGTQAVSNRFRSGGFQYGTSVVQPRIEDVAEMTISTSQLDLSGTGAAAMRISMVTRRGTNAFHGRVFEDFRNTVLNANSWINNARGLPRGILKLNDFGGGAGGYIIKNKLFFFGTWAESIQPGVSSSSPSVLSAAAQQGLFTYRDTTGALQTVNVLSIGGGAGGPSTILPNIGSQFSKINGVLNNGSLTPTSDPNISTFSFLVPNRTTTYYPALRFDYNATNNVRLYVSYSQTKRIGAGVNPPNFPGGIDPIDFTSSNSNNKIAGFGADWVIRPTLINQFHAGFLYQYSIFDPENLGIDLPSISQQFWGYGTSLYGSAYPRQPISSLYPMLTWNDSLTWQKGSHSMTFGGGWWREQDHYWNGPGGYPGYSFGITAQDPLGAAFSSGLKNASSTSLNNAENLYAELVGRVSGVNIAGGGRPLDPATKQYKPFGQYNLDEVVSAWNFFAQDRWKLRPNLTLNYGLRWDIYGDDHDVNGGYSSPASVADFWGPTPVGAIFQPGNLGGVQNPSFTAKVHAYNTSWKNLSPAIALAWTPQSDGDGFLGKILGKDKTVIRTGWSLRSFTEGAQNFWAFASNQGSFFFQQGNLSPDTSGAPGTFKPGSLTFGQTLPAYGLFPQAWASTLPASTLSFGQTSFFAMNPNIRYPYVEQWNFGIQRQLGGNSVLEVRYLGNMGMHTWMSYNINEVNVFENGFLKEFQAAQNNLRVNQSNGKNSFANLGFPGDVGLPIMTAAFGSATSSNFTSGSFITNLQTGGAGAMAQTLARSQAFFCNMVGAKFSPCASVPGVTANGAGYPINFWEANPFTTGFSLNYLDAAGHSNYQSMQVEFRQRPTHGMQFNVNYTLGHAFALAPVNGYQANVASQTGTVAALYLTDRNFRLNYQPSAFDVRHVIHGSGTYDLPFGRNKAFFNNSRLANEVLGGWTLGTILTFQTGVPVQVSGGYNTVNQNDSGVVFNGTTASQFQQSVGLYHSGSPWAYIVSPSQFIASNGAANGSTMTPNINAGVWGYRPLIYNPHWFNTDFSVNKSIPIREQMRMTFQAEFLNVFNHPTFSLTSLNIQSLTFGQSTGGPTGPRNVEFRLNFEF
jgi:hypothetical protein